MSSQRDEARRRVQAWEPWLGAVVTALPADPVGAGPLSGLIAGVKDLLWVRGAPRLCGAPGLVDARPAIQDAAAVALLRGAGADIVATLQTHQFAYGIVTPQTRNPRAPDRVAGGSSGGAGAAIAAGLVDVAIGTDTGGSIRIPAACCGVAGIKPTFGSVSVDGVQPLAPSLDTVGPLARDVALLRRTLEVLLDRDVAATGTGTPRVGVPAETAAQRMDPEVRAAWERACAELAARGVAVTEVSLPALPEAPRANGVVLGLEALATHGELLAARPDGWWPQVRERLEAARRLSDEDLTAALEVRDRLRAQLAAALDEVDVLLTPTLPCRVPLAGADQVTVGGKPEAITPALTRLTSPWNLIGAPAGSVPWGHDEHGAPLGLQVVGAWHQEDVVLQVMALLEELAGGPWPPAVPPGGAPAEDPSPNRSAH